MKIISFCLWGNNPKYTIGAIKNADLAKKFYSDWVCRFYCDNTVPSDIIQELKKKNNTEIVQLNVKGDWKFTINRFLPISENNLSYMISRDTDSRISEREVNAVNAWLNSDKSAHIMRDHPFHGSFPMLAGMFGVKGGIIKNINSLLKLHKSEEQYHYDQLFLYKYIYPIIEDDTLIHDEIFTNNPFPTNRTNLNFVGQVFDENDNTVQEHIDSLKKYLEKK